MGTFSLKNVRAPLVDFLLSPHHPAECHQMKGPTLEAAEEADLG